MRDLRFYTFLHKQIPVIMVLSLFPGLGYVFLGWMHDIHTPALIWYGVIVAISVWGYLLHKEYSAELMSRAQLASWYRRLTVLFYLFFLLWVAIFLIYVTESEYKLHYIAIFTQIGASVVASTLLTSDKRLYAPIITFLMVPLIIYFFLLGEWYGYVLTIFASVFMWVLFYAAGSSFTLLQQTSQQATHDILTGLRNRNFFIQYLQRTMNTLRDSRGFSYLLLIDLDHFKTVNDSLGHDVGDHLLQEVTLRLNQLLPKGAVLARLGGDEFIVTSEEFKDVDRCRDGAVALSDTLVDVLKESYVIDRHQIYISASIGISLIDSSSDNANRFIKEADIAMYEAKARGRDGVFLFSEEMSQRVEQNLEIERLLHFALDNGEISLNFQPQLDSQRRVVGSEALVRWHSEQLGQVSPVEFIPIAERTGFIIDLGEFIVESAFKTLRSWHDKGIELEQFSINISMRQFLHGSFVDEIKRLSGSYLDDVLRRKVILELTESIVAEDLQQVVVIMQELKVLGFRFSMDDFGTGYSSLSHLKQMPIDELKIDRSFVSALGSEEGDWEMVTTILKMAQIFKLTTVAEGVETEEQAAFLLDHDCDILQGYHFSRPLPETGFEHFYRDNCGG